MKRHLFTFAALVLPAVGLWGQNPITLEYNVQQLREEFSEENANWNYMSSVENLYMPDKGDLFMHRNNPNSAYAFVTKWENSLRVFSIISRLKMGPAETPDQSIGIVCLVQRDGKGAVVVEFNKFKQYRVKQLVGAYYRYISGTAEDKGWVKSNLLRGKDDYNDLEVRAALPQVDVYINGKFAQSFDVPDYGPGQMGLVIGPGTKAKADFFHVHATSQTIAAGDSSAVVNNTPVTPIEQITKLRFELEMKDRDLRECQTERIKAVSVMEDQIGGLISENQRLTMQNKQLAEFRNEILVDMDEDAFLTVARSLKDEIVKNQRLESQVQTYRDSLRTTHQTYSKLKLALLDKSIKKAEVQKVERDRQESINTKSEIEAELQDKRLTKEQEEWERKNFKPIAATESTAPDAKPVEQPVGKPKEDKKSEGKAGKKDNPNKEIAAPPSEALPEASPLPIPVRKAEKKND
ncbi:MAG: hypothetical protein K9J06_05985 [Flavobacteriales bacterium]|nr:hypothetical protein [Flavobacteriales bacterium]